MLNEIKKYLSITWQDEDIDSKLEMLLAQSKAAITSLTGTVIDFETNQEAKELLFNRVRYAYNNALEYFETNFQKEILRLQLREAVVVNENTRKKS